MRWKGRSSGHVYAEQSVMGTPRFGSDLLRKLKEGVRSGWGIVLLDEEDVAGWSGPLEREEVMASCLCGC